MKKFLLIFIMAVLHPLTSGADIIILKNGMKFASEKVWEEDDEIKCYRDGLVVGFPKDDVERIDKTPPEAVENGSPAGSQPAVDVSEGRRTSSEQPEGMVMALPMPEQRHGLNIPASKQQMTRIQQELHSEYRALLKKLGRLEADLKALSPGSDRTGVDERLRQYNRKVKIYERKRRSFNRDAKALKAKVEEESRRRLADNNKFSAMLEGWVTRPIVEFIKLWGYPDQIINRPDGRRQYLFAVQITPHSARKIFFITNSSGKIIAFSLDVE